MIFINRLIIENVRIISPEEQRDEVTNLYINDGRIAEPFRKTEQDTVIDGTGLVAMPGLVDLHVHLRDPGQEEKEDIITGTNAAAAGGVTSLLCMPNTNPTIDNAGVISYIKEKAKNCKSRVYIAGSITMGLEGKEPTDLKALRKAGAIGLSDDGRPVLDPEIMAEAMKKAPELGMTVVAHCEDLELADGGKINKGKMSEKLGIKGIPAEAEDKGTKREINLAKENNVPVHICHVSTKTSVQMIREAKEDGVKVTAETAPHYFTLTEDVLEKRDADYRMNPPLRTEEDRLAIIEGLADGTLDCIATDHAPHSVEEKSKPLTEAPSGIIGLETALSLGITNLVDTGKVSMMQLLACMSCNPAKMYGLNAGNLAIDSTADVVIFDPKAQWTVEKFASKSSNSPFAGNKLTGVIKYTIVNGNVYPVR